MVLWNEVVFIPISCMRHYQSGRKGIEKEIFFLLHLVLINDNKEIVPDEIRNSK